MQTPLGSINDDTLVLPEALTVDVLQSKNFASTYNLPQTLMVSAANVHECDSVGIAALVWLVQQATKQGKIVHFQALPIVMTQLLELYDLHKKELISDAGKTD